MDEYMVLIFQIASGIVLGVLLLWLFFSIFSRSPTLERAIGNLLVTSALFGAVAWGLISNWVITLLIISALMGFIILIFAMFYAWGLIRKDQRWIKFKIMFSFFLEIIKKPFGLLSKIVPPFLWAPLGVLIWIAVETYLHN